MTRCLVPNGSFDERPWKDVPCGNTLNQEPLDWKLRWYEVGESLKAVWAGHGDTETTALTRPECVHKLEEQLPLDERRYRLDGSVNPDRLILDLNSKTVYKIFSGYGSFGAVLEGVMKVLPGKRIKLYVPVRTHHHGNGDLGAAYWRFLVRDRVSHWFTFKRDFKDREYRIAELSATSDSSGLVTYKLQVESHTIAGIDFFTNKIEWEYLEEESEPEPVPVPDPAPDPEPAPISYSFPVIEKGSKLTSHAIGEGGTFDLVKYLASNEAPLRFLKVVAPRAPQDLPAARNLKNLSPSTRIIGRVLFGDDGFNTQGWGPSLNPETYMSHFTEWARTYPEVEWWELWNEQDPPGTEGHVEMARFSIECMRIAELNGYKLALMSYSTGVPEPEEWQAIWNETQFFQRAKAGGHILSLHAYSRTSDEEATQAHLLRPKWLYENILIPNNCVTPFLHTEYSINETSPGIGISDWGVLTLIDEYSKVDDLLSDMWYCLGACIYTFGQLQHYNHDRLWKPIGDLILSKRDRQNALPPTQGDEEDLHLYDVTTIIADPTYMSPNQLNEAYLLGRQRLQTVTPSWQYAVPFEEERPKEWKSNTIIAGPLPLEDRPRYLEWVKARDPGTILIFDSSSSPSPTPSFEVPPIPFSQRHELWRNIKLGPSPYTVGQSGCLVTAIASWFTLVDPSITPLKLVSWLNANNAFQLDGRLLVAVPTKLYEEVQFAGYYLWRGPDKVADISLIRQALLRGPVVIQVDFYPGDDPLDSHFVLALKEVDGDILAIDPWTGDYIWVMQRYGRGTLDRSIFAMLDYRLNVQPAPPSPAPTVPPFIGLNDPQNEGAYNWLTGGLAVIPISLIGGPANLKFSKPNVRVIVNLRYSWSTDTGHAGTLPAPGAARQQFIQNAIQTISQSEGVWGWEMFNEQNNPREHPKDYSLTPQDIVTVYNQVRSGVLNVPNLRMSLGSLDPFNALAGDPKDWLVQTYEGISGAEFVAVHGYIRGPDASLVFSEAKFDDDPLRWQYLNYPRCITELLKYLPDRYKKLPVYVTEFNHIWRSYEAPDQLGWVNDPRAREVVLAAYGAALTAGFSGLAIYRWTSDQWAVHNNNYVLGAIKDLLE